MIFLQAPWRSCGTYLWNKFRATGKFCTYLEPFHEDLLDAQTKTYEEQLAGGITDTLRHPKTDRHYFAEYKLKEDGGVKYFAKRFSYDSYYLGQDERDDALKSYLKTLNKDANGRPILKCCRAGLKTAWLKKNFSGPCIYLKRGVDATFNSYWSLGGQNSYFLKGIALILSKNRAMPMFYEMAKDLSMPYIEREVTKAELDAAGELIQDWDIQKLRDMVFLHWSLVDAHNLKHADLVLDMDLLPLEKDYRQDIQDRLNDLLATSISLSDARPSSVLSAPGSVISPERHPIVIRALQTLSETP